MSSMPDSDQVEDQEHEFYHPIGGILYAQNQKMALVVVDSKGALKSWNVPEFDPEDAAGDERIVNLGDYVNIAIAQADVGPASFRTVPDVSRRGSSVDTRLLLTDTSTGRAGQYYLGEDDLLRLITGEHGGMVTFQGAGSPKENALVIEVSRNTHASALVVFLHPTESDWLDSVTGVEHFFRSVNQEFMRDTKLPPRVRSAIKTLDREINNIKNGLRTDDKVEDSVRIEIFKAALIAHARLTSSAKAHQEFLDKHLPTVEGFARRRVFPPLAIIPDWPRLSLSIEEVVNKLMVSNKMVRQGEKPIGLITQKVIDLVNFYRQELGASFGIARDTYSIEMMKNLFKQIVAIAHQTEDLDVLRDTELVLRELSVTDYAHEQKCTFMRLSETSPPDERNLDEDHFATSGDTQNVKKIIDEALLPAIATKKVKLNQARLNQMHRK